MREEAEKIEIDGLYYPYHCNSTSTDASFCRRMPDTKRPDRLGPVIDFNTFAEGDNYLLVMIDLEYNPNNSISQDHQNIVKNDTVIYCVHTHSCFHKALYPIRVVTYNSCQSMTSQSTVSQPAPSSTMFQLTSSKPIAPLVTTSQPIISQPIMSESPPQLVIDASATPSFISVHFFNLLFHLVNLILLILLLTIGWRTNKAITTSCARGKSD